MALGTSELSEIKEEVIEVESDSSDESVDEEIVIVNSEEEIPESTSEDSEVKTDKKGRPNANKRIRQLITKGKKKESEYQGTIDDMQREIANLKSRNVIEDKRTKKNEFDIQMDTFKKEKLRLMEESRFDEVADVDTKQMQYIQKNSSEIEDGPVNPEEYFTKNYDWYLKDSEKTLEAIKISKEIESDSKFSHLTPKQRLDEVGRRTENNFRENPYRSANTSEGAPMHHQSKSQVYITRDDMDEVQKMYPGMTPTEIKQKALQYKKASNERGEG